MEETIIAPKTIERYRLHPTDPSTKPKPKRNARGHLCGGSLEAKIARMRRFKEAQKRKKG